MKRYDVLAIALFLFGTLIYGYGFHNLDLSFNAKYGAIDTNGFGYSQGVVQMHLNGLSMLEVSMAMMGLGFLLLLSGKHGDI